MTADRQAATPLSLGPLWFGEAGWRFIQHAPLAGPQSLLVAQAA